MADGAQLGTVPWSIKGELILNCNCTVFCPCVVSLGKHPPTEGYCQAWVGIRIDEGAYGDASLAGLNVGLMMDIPGNMGRGNWKAAAYIDERASDDAYDGFGEYFQRCGARHDRIVQNYGQRVFRGGARGGGLPHRG